MAAAGLVEKDRLVDGAPAGPEVRLGPDFGNEETEGSSWRRRRDAHSYHARSGMHHVKSCVGGGANLPTGEKTTQNFRKGGGRYSSSGVVHRQHM